LIHPSLSGLDLYLLSPSRHLLSLRYAQLGCVPGYFRIAADAAHHEEATLFNSGGTEKNRSAADKR